MREGNSRSASGRRVRGGDRSRAAFPVALSRLVGCLAAGVILVGCRASAPPPAPPVTSNPSPSAPPAAPAETPPGAPSPSPGQTPGSPNAPGQTPGGAPPAAAPDARELLFPHALGDTWELTTKEAKSTFKIRRTIVETRKDVSGKTTFVVELQRDGTPVHREEYVIDESGVSHTAFGMQSEIRFDPPLPMLRLPFQPDSTWDWMGTYRSAEGSVPCKVFFKLTGPEPIKTAAGSFYAYRLDQQYTEQAPEGSRTYTTAQWYSPKVGLVKQVIRENNSQTVAELTSYKVAP